jgi:hypothetical protein
MKKNTFLLIFSLFSLLPTQSQGLFNSQQISEFSRSHMLFPFDLKLDAVTLDFNGDGMDDFLTYNYENTVESNPYFGIMNYIMLGFNIRRNVIPLSPLFLNSPLQAIHHSIDSRDPFDRLLVLTNTKVQLISYHHDPMITYLDRYTIHDLFYNLDGLEEIYKTTIGHFTFNENCVLLVVKRHGKTQVEFFKVIDGYLQRSNNRREILASYPIHQIPQAVHAGKINDDDYDDILFEMDDHWLLWLTMPDDIRIIGSYTIPYPDASIQTQSVLFHPTNELSLLLGVESSLDRELAFVSVKNTGDEHQYNPVAQSGYLQNQQSLGSKCTFFQWKDPYTSMPILLIGNPYTNQEEEQNPYSVYTFTSSPDMELKHIQNIDFSPGTIQDDNFIFLNTPLTTGDFNGDQVTDLLFTCVTYRMDKPLNKHQNFLIIDGQSQTTAIPAREWLRLD